MQVVKELELKGLLAKAEREQKEQKKMEELQRLRQSISPLRHYAFAIVGTNWFSNLIMAVIIANTILITLQTVPSVSDNADWRLDAVDSCFLGIYIFELGAKLFALRFQYFKSYWNCLDCLLVLTSLSEHAVVFVMRGMTTNIDFKIFRVLRVFRTFRALRALRVLRTITFLRNLQVLVTTLMRSIPAMSSILALLILFLYIFSIMCIDLLKDVYPERFGNLSKTIFTLFQVVTLDDWFEIYQTVRTRQPELGTTTLILLTMVILVETFILINLFIAVIVNNLEKSNELAIQQQNAYKSRMQSTEEEKLLMELADRSIYAGSRLSSIASNANDLQLNSNAKLAESTEGSIGMDSLKKLPGYNYFSPREIELLKDYFALLASTESHLERYFRNLKTMDDLVDAVEKAEFLREGVIDAEVDSEDENGGDEEKTVTKGATKM